MKPRKRIDAEKIESEIKKDYYTCQPAPSELTYGPEQREGCPIQGLRAISLPVER